jgi:23S rRNA (adenine1618-N6)-methyltransferase
MSQPPRRNRPAPRNAAAGLHPRNRHQGRYDFDALVAASPQLAAHVITTPAGAPSIDFANPDAVRALNRALLEQQYGIVQWDIPAGYLCPPVPGRADYVHGLADLLASDHGGVIPRGPAVRVLDVGVGANCIYPLIGVREYGWRFVGSEIDSVAIAAAAAVLAANPDLDEAIELRQQPQRGKVFAGILRPDERFDLSMCNPPFHASAEAAAQGSRRKLGNLGRDPAASKRSALNFGGQPGELWCTGGEASFLRRMVNESVAIGERIRWFSSLVSRADTVPGITRQLRRAGAADVRVVPMAQGSKQSRFVAWSFMDLPRRASW